MNKNFTFSLPPEQMEEVALLAKKNVRSISNQVQFMLSMAIELLNKLTNHHEQDLEMDDEDDTQTDDLDLATMTEAQMLKLTPEQQKQINKKYKNEFAKYINK